MRRLTSIPVPAASHFTQIVASAAFDTEPRQMLPGKCRFHQATAAGQIVHFDARLVNWRSERL